MRVIESPRLSGIPTVCIVGLGYVGLPLAVAFDDANYETIGYDIDSERIEAFSAGRDVTGEIGNGRIQSSNIIFTDDPSRIRHADFILVTVATPLAKIRTPKLKYVEDAARTIGEHLTPGATVVLESTVYPGVTRDVVQPIIAEASGLTPTEEFNVGYSPERLSPGSEGVSLTDAVKIVGADTPGTLTELTELYRSIIDAGVYEAPSIETAEAAKVLENVQRDLNIALMNEMAIICEHLGLETQEVIEACSTKWNFHEYSPGLVGGHCIPVDPLYLAYGSERAGFSPNLILQAREINEYMPKHVAEITTKALNRAGKALCETSVLILGVAYKPNVKDTRTSEVTSVIRELAEYRIESTVYDPIADLDSVTDDLQVKTIDDIHFTGFDGILLSTPHTEFFDINFRRAISDLAREPVFIDVYGVLDEEELTNAGYTYNRL